MKFTSELINKAWTIRKEAAARMDVKVKVVEWKPCFDLARESMTAKSTMEPKEVTVSKEFGSYNARRYSKPWGAVVTFVNGKPKYDFCGWYAGVHNPKKDSEGEVFVKALTGSIVAFGQKDFRGGNTENQWYVVNADGTLTETSQQEAAKLAN